MLLGSFFFGQAQGIVTVDVCGENGLLHGSAELSWVENGPFQRPAVLSSRCET
jgi:hypothetical protein